MRPGLPPVRYVPRLSLPAGYGRAMLRYDLQSGVTVAVFAVPQVMAYAKLAGVAPVHGLYTLVTASLIGAWWGFSPFVSAGPSNSAALLCAAGLLIAVGATSVVFALNRSANRFPVALAAIILATLVAEGIAGWRDVARVRDVAVVSPGLPGFRFFAFDPVLVWELLPFVMAVAVIGLIAVATLTKALNARRGIEETNDNQEEFVGQGLAQLTAAFFQGIPCSGSFSRSALLALTGVQTRLGNLFYAQARSLRRQLRRILDQQRPRYILIRMRRIYSIDFACWHVLFEIARELAHTGGRLYLCDVLPEIRPMMLRSGMEQFVQDEQIIPAIGSQYGSLCLAAEAAARRRDQRVPLSEAWRRFFHDGEI